MPSALRPLVGDCPASRSVPLVGDRMQPRIDSSVVLPLPEGPISRVSSPAIRSTLTPLSGITSPAPERYTLVISRASSMVIPECVMVVFSKRG